MAASGTPADGRDGAATTLHCFGAAARDTLKPCDNPRLRYMVRPRPSVAQLTPHAPCDRLEEYSRGVRPCAFGVPPDEAVATVALIGDSHADHWRAAVHEAALARRWAGISIANSVCPVSETRPRWGKRRLHDCDLWNAGLIRWLSERPEVTIVVHGQMNNHKDVFKRPGQSWFEAKVSGFRRVWRAFPPTVRYIVVMRDVPRAAVGTPSCVMRARARRRPPGRTCALPRASALLRDPFAAAARRSQLAQVHLAELTRFFCDRRLCYPVVGGALVHRDVDHMTQTFARTLGPYLLRRLDQIVPRPN